MLELDQAALAERANLSRNVIVDFEKGRRTPTANNLAAIQRVLEAGGVIFLAEGEGRDGGPGLRLARSTADDQSIEGDDLNSSNDE